MQRQVTLNQFLTEAEIQRCVEIFNESRATPTLFHRTILSEIIRPNINRINADLGQQNDPDYLAYMIEYVLEAWNK